MKPHAAQMRDTKYVYDGWDVVAGMDVPDNPYYFAGREKDATGLYNLRYRYYSPVLGRFISEDPIGFAGGDVNFYAYVGNSPLNFSDPLGLFNPVEDWSRTIAPYMQNELRAYKNMADYAVDYTDCYSRCALKQLGLGLAEMAAMHQVKKTIAKKLGKAAARHVSYVGALTDFYTGYKVLSCASQCRDELATRYCKQ